MQMGLSHIASRRGSESQEPRPIPSGPRSCIAAVGMMLTCAGVRALPLPPSRARRHVQSVECDIAVIHDEQHVGYVADVGERIAVHGYEIGLVAHLD
jgi:hypothetical protein